MSRPIYKSMNTSPNFRMTPTSEELSLVERDLRFHICENANPRRLTAAEIAAFNRDGYLTGIRIFSDDVITEQRRHFDAILAGVLAAGGSSYSISTAHLKYGAVYDLLMHPRIVSYVKDLLGENVIGWGSHYFCKLPRDGKAVTWHQDAI